MIAASLFSGIGAPEVAMPHWRWAWCAEIEKFPSAVMAARHPLSVNMGDVTADGFAEKAGCIARPDIVVFGSPCQSFSIAGKRLGLDDPRGNLALVALGIIDRLKPRWFVFENVPGLLSSADGRDFGLFLRAVDELGYRGGWASLDAQYRGLAQRRERLFFVGHLGDWRYPAAVLFEPEGLCGHSAPRRKAGERVAGTIAAGAHPSGFNGRDAERGNIVTHALRADGFDASEDGTGRGTPLITHALDSFSAGRMTEDGTGRGCPIVPIAFSQKDYGADVSEEIAPTMRAMGHDASHANAGGQLAVAFHENQRAELTFNDTAGSLKVGGGKPGQGYPSAFVGSAVRRLTPRECERLQGFHDDYTLITYRGKPAADGPRYKALGNSMAVPVVRWILQRIEATEAIGRSILSAETARPRETE